MLNNYLVTFTWDPPRVYRKACRAVGGSLPEAGSADTWPPATYKKSDSGNFTAHAPTANGATSLKNRAITVADPDPEWIRIDSGRLDPDLGGQI